MRGHQARAGQKPRAAVRVELHLPELGPGHRVEDVVAIEACELLVHEAVVRRQQSLRGPVVLEDDVFDERLDLFGPEGTERAVERRVDARILRHAVEMGQQEPLGVEVANEVPGLVVVEHARGLRGDLLLGLELIGLRRGEQLGVRHRVPKHVRELGGHLPTGERDDVTLDRGLPSELRPVEERRRLKRGLDHDLNAVFEAPEVGSLTAQSNTLLSRSISACDRGRRNARPPKSRMKDSAQASLPSSPGRSRAAARSCRGPRARRRPRRPSCTARSAGHCSSGRPPGC